VTKAKRKVRELSVERETADRPPLDPAVRTHEGPGPLSPLAEAVEGFTGLARWLTSRIGGHARTVAGLIDSGTYTPDLAARDMARSGALAVSAWMRIVNEVVDAAVVVARPPGPNTYDIPVELPEDFEGPCWLRLDRLPASQFDPADEIPRTRVSLLPKELLGSERNFTIHVDATRLPGVTYWGRVLVESKTNSTNNLLINFRVGVR
jgi:hypothetical protein